MKPGPVITINDLEAPFKTIVLEARRLNLSRGLFLDNNHKGCIWERLLVCLRGLTLQRVSHGDINSATHMLHSDQRSFW